MTIDETVGWVVLILAATLALSLLVRVAATRYECRRAAELAEERWIGATLTRQELGLRGRGAIELAVAKRLHSLRSSEMPTWLITRALDKGWLLRHVAFVGEWRPPAAGVSHATLAPSAEREPR